MSWELIEPFDIDNGELENLPQEECFTLGVEWAKWRMKILDGTVKTDLCIAANALRIQAMLERHGIPCEARPAGPHGWSEIWVGKEEAE